MMSKLFLKLKGLYYQNLVGCLTLPLVKYRSIYFTIINREEFLDFR